MSFSTRMFHRSERFVYVAADEIVSTCGAIGLCSSNPHIVCCQTGGGGGGVFTDRLLKVYIATFQLSKLVG